MFPEDDLLPEFDDELFPDVELLPDDDLFPEEDEDELLPDEDLFPEDDELLPDDDLFPEDDEEFSSDFDFGGAMVKSFKNELPNHNFFRKLFIFKKTRA